MGRERLFLRWRAPRSAHGCGRIDETNAFSLATRFAGQRAWWRAICLQAYRHIPRAAARTTVRRHLLHQRYATQIAFGSTRGNTKPDLPAVDRRRRAGA